MAIKNHVQFFTLFHAPCLEGQEDVVRRLTGLFGMFIWNKRRVCGESVWFYSKYSGILPSNHFPPPWLQWGYFFLYFFHFYFCSGFFDFTWLFEIHSCSLYQSFISFYCKQYSAVWTYNNVFIYSLIDGDLGRVQILAIVNKVDCEHSNRHLCIDIGFYFSWWRI